MQRLKELAEKYSKWSNLKIQIARIELQIDNDWNAAIGSSKSLLESICKTILDSEGEKYTDKDNINRLAKKTIRSLGINDPKSIEFGNAIITAIRGLSSIRNNMDDSSHGKSLILGQQNIDEITASFLIHSTEAISCFLIDFYEANKSYSSKKEVKYEELEEFNNYLNNEYGCVDIARISCSTSEALFAVDKAAYDYEYRSYLEVVNEQIN
jgi:hypothetical protein